jgi:hypothetical protein
MASYPFYRRLKTTARMTDFVDGVKSMKELASVINFVV